MTTRQMACKTISGCVLWTHRTCGAVIAMPPSGDNLRRYAITKVSRFSAAKEIIPCLFSPLFLLEGVPCFAFNALTKKTAVSLLSRLAEKRADIGPA